MFVAANDPRPKLFAAGSVAALAGKDATVWGSGIMYRNDVLCPAARFVAVRGPLTRARALQCGAECPEVFGDPALLLPRLLPAAPGRRQGVSVVLHYSDAARFSGPPAGLGVRLIDIQSPICDVVQAIATSEVVASSSLHGIIVSHAYGVPAVWLKLRQLPAGDDVKFHDHYLSIDQDPPAPLRAHGTLPHADEIRRAAGPLPRVLDAGKLWRAFPYRILP